jgi:hypothetical protein
MLLIMRRLKKSRHRGMMVEYTLISLLVVSSAFQVLVFFGVKAV